MTREQVYKEVEEVLRKYYKGKLADNDEDIWTFNLDPHCLAVHIGNALLQGKDEPDHISHKDKMVKDIYGFKHCLTCNGTGDNLSDPFGKEKCVTCRGTGRATPKSDEQIQLDYYDLLNRDVKPVGSGHTGACKEGCQCDVAKMSKKGKDEPEKHDFQTLPSGRVECTKCHKTLLCPTPHAGDSTCDGCNNGVALYSQCLGKGKDECPEKEPMRGKCCNKSCCEYSSYSNDCIKSYDWKIRLCPIYVQWEEGTGLKTPEKKDMLDEVEERLAKMKTPSIKDICPKCGIKYPLHRGDCSILKTPEHCEIEPLDIKYSSAGSFSSCVADELFYIKAKVEELRIAVNKLSGKDI